MDPLILVLNAGSSSLKFSLFRRTGADWAPSSRGQIEGIGTSPRLTVKGDSAVDEPLDASVRDAAAAIEVLAARLKGDVGKGRLVAVGHRVVHGGPRHSAPVRVTREILAELEGLSALAPLHQPHNLAPIAAMLDRLPDVPQVAVFDTGFHRGHSPVTTLIALPRAIREGGVERYGFHGISYEYIASALPAGLAGGRVVVAHLGSGASLCALKAGRSVDTTMGFTALDGLCMGTRPGALDPGVVLYLFQKLGLTVKQVEDLLYRKSGLLGISGISNDMRDLLGRMEPEARLAVDFFVHRAAQEIGALTASLGGLDALVFTAGIGENSPEIRRRICESSAWLGIDLDAAANAAGGPRISTAASRVSAWVLPTNEERMIARHVRRLLGL